MPEPREDPNTRGFHPLHVEDVVCETPDSVSLVLREPGHLRSAFAYEAGQYCTFRVEVDGTALHRCYSMSSTPGIDERLTVTVKRVPGGAVSNWINDNVTPGDTIEATTPAGTFLLARNGDGDARHEDPAAEILALAAGSGITPIISIIKSALASGTHRIRLLYANRDRDSVIFAAKLDELVAASGGRLEVIHHHDVDSGFLDEPSVLAALGDEPGAGVHAYVCGPEPFMDIAEAALATHGLDASRVHLERFTPADDGAAEQDGEQEPTAGSPAGGSPATVTIELDGTTATAEHREGTTVLQVARQAGLAPPYSCEAGNCATCMARVLSGSVQMRVNDALTDDEVDEGWILTCQSVPTSAELHVQYGYD